MEFQNNQIGEVVLPRVIQELITEFVSWATTEWVPEWWDMCAEDWTRWKTTTHSSPEVFLECSLFLIFFLPSTM